MYYSIIDDEFLIEDEETADLQEVEVNGLILEINFDSIESGEVTRIISSNPSDYLIPQYQPGTKVEFKPSFG